MIDFVGGDPSLVGQVGPNQPQSRCDWFKI